MPRFRRVHEVRTLDLLESIGGQHFSEEIWRVTRKERAALASSMANGRWSPQAEIEVLYTSLLRDGALSEIGFRLSSEPVWPSQIRHDIHQIDCNLDNVLPLDDMGLLERLGVNVEHYERFDYERTQAIAAAARFLEFDGILVPNARFDCTNLVVFPECCDIDERLNVQSSEPVDWKSWRKINRR